MNNFSTQLLEINQEQLDFSKNSKIYWYNSPPLVQKAFNEGLRRNSPHQVSSNYTSSQPIEITVLEDNSFVLPPQDPLLSVQQTVITLTVDTTADQNDGSASNGLSLRDAILIANADPNNDYIIQLQGGQIYSLTLQTPFDGEDAAANGDLDIIAGGQITIQGTGNQSAIIDANQINSSNSFKGDNRVFEVLGNAALSLTNVTITGGRNSGITIEQNGSATLTNVSVSNNTGKGIYNYGTATISNSTINNNNPRADFFSNDGGGLENTGILTVTNSTISNNINKSVGGGLNNQGTLNISNSIIDGNTAYYGGGINNEGTANISNSDISGNTATLSGLGSSGGFNNNDGATLAITASTIGNNNSSEGVAITNRGTLMVSQSLINHNNATSGTSDNYSTINNLATAIVSGSTITGNAANGVGNDILAGTDAILVVANSTADGNSGHGVYVGKGKATVINSTISNNQTNGIINYANATIINSLINNNFIHDGRGGGIANVDFSDTRIFNSTIALNSSPIGGGIYNRGNNKVIIVNSTINNNNANDGGGIYNDFIAYPRNGGANGIDDDGDGQIDEPDEGQITVGTSSIGVDLTLTNTTISGNAANVNGGGIFDGSGDAFVSPQYVASPSVITINDSTIANNTADADNNGDGNGGGLLIESGGEVNVANSIIASNFDTPNNGGVGEIFPDIVGRKITGNNYNLIGSLAGSNGNIGIGTDIVTPNPGLSPLQDNGGSTQVWNGIPGFPNGIFSSGVTLTHALLPGSPALDRGNNALLPVDTYDLNDNSDHTELLPVDQRGKNFSRIANGTVDMGAFEVPFAVIDPAQYGASNPDLIPIYRDNLEAYNQHYNNSGRFERRDTDTFDEFRYIASNPDLIPIFGLNGNAATLHYLSAGFFENRPLASFSPARYLDSYDDLLGVYGTNTAAATQQYITNGFAEGRDPNLFPSDRYIASYGDLIQTYGYNLEAGSNHYLFSGRGEGRQVTFDPFAYLNRYPDLQAIFGSNLTAATEHYIEHGFAEGRTWL